MANQKVNDIIGASGATSGYAMAFADSRGNDGVHTATTEWNYFDDDLYDDTVVAPWRLADTSEYLAPMQSGLTLRDAQYEYLCDNTNSDGVYEVLPATFNDENKKKKKGIKAFLTKLFSQGRKDNNGNLPSVQCVAACNQEVATASNAEALQSGSLLY